MGVTSIAGLGRSTRNRLKPRVRFGAFSMGVVLVTKTIPLARSAPEMKVLRPLTTYPSPSFTAKVCVFRVLVPASGSVKAKQNSMPLAIFGRYFSFWLSFPCLAMEKPPKTEVKQRNHVPASPQLSEVRVSIASIMSNIPMPPPPYFSGMGKPTKPASTKAFQKSSGNVCVLSFSRQYSGPKSLAISEAA